jgi:TIR domain-containing protein
METAAPYSSAKEAAMDRPRIEAADVEQLATVVIGGLAEGKPVEIDGLGVFYPDPARGFRFEPRRQAQVFVAYVTEDAAAAGKLCDALQEAGFTPWIDTRKLLPGQNWPRAIESAIEMSDFFVACFSHNSVDKKGGFQAEVRYGLDCARHMPLDEIFLAPVRLDDCRVPRSIQRELQYVDLFPDWQRGIKRLIQMMRRGSAWQKRWR